jgi:hypothetical protein
MKDNILLLRSQGKSYREIEKELGCSRGLISYYLNPNGKLKNNERQNRNRFIKRLKYKKLFGGKCSICGYSKSLNALHFHHKDTNQKKFNITSAIWGTIKASDEEIRLEINKCSLVCANCHAEIHTENEFF